jgi:hypothetical protein
MADTGKVAVSEDMPLRVTGEAVTYCPRSPISTASPIACSFASPHAERE